MITIDGYQEFTGTTAIYPKERALDYLMAGLGSEVGEVLGKYKKEIRDGEEYTDAIIAELGDVCWYVARLCDELGYSLSKVMQMNKDKLLDRQRRDVIKGNGDDR